MNRKLKSCMRCGVESFVFGYGEHCPTCSPIVRREKNLTADKSLLETMYSDIEFVGLTEHGKVQWSFVHDCGNKQIWIIGNIKKQLKLRPGKVPCKRCGGKERMSVALKAYSDKYGIKDIENWTRYRTKVRNFSNRNFIEHQFDINPLGLKRGPKFHLDHKRSIVECFLAGVPPEVAAAKENLQMLPASVNLSKGRK